MRPRVGFGPLDSHFCRHRTGFGLVGKRILRTRFIRSSSWYLGHEPSMEACLHVRRYDCLRAIYPCLVGLLPYLECLLMGEIDFGFSLLEDRIQGLYHLPFRFRIDLVEPHDQVVAFTAASCSSECVCLPSCGYLPDFGWAGRRCCEGCIWRVVKQPIPYRFQYRLHTSCPLHGRR